MITYHITIVNRTTNIVQYFKETSETVDEVIKRELGTWSNFIAMTHGVTKNKKEFFQAGTTRDNSKCFSILAIE